MQIGSFMKTSDGYEGRIQSLTLDAPVSLIPAQNSDAENAPQWRLLHGDAELGIEIGAGWNRIGERAGAYIAVQFDDPHFAEPIRANLIQVSAHHPEHILFWTRPLRRGRD